MISLPGLALATGRPELAAPILRTFAQFVSQGMLPNRFPDGGDAPEYNTVDATLWYVHAIRAYVDATGDDALLRDLWPVLQEIVDWHVEGTRYGIRSTRPTGCCAGGEPGVQLTWMDAKVGDRVVTPRIGKPVEVNALWYNALRLDGGLRDAARRAERRRSEHAGRRRARGLRALLERRRPATATTCSTGPTATRRALRPNQLLAVALGEDLLDEPAPARDRGHVRACAADLARPALARARRARVRRALRRRPDPARRRVPPGHRVGLADRPVRRRPPARLRRSGRGPAAAGAARRSPAGRRPGHRRRDLRRRTRRSPREAASPRRGASASCCARSRGPSPTPANERQNTMSALAREKVKLGITPTLWWNDDFPSIDAGITFGQCVSEMALAGLRGLQRRPQVPDRRRRAQGARSTCAACASPSRG